jgi:Rrf2 family transcriptional regulator, cysteine metabolism repressor
VQLSTKTRYSLRALAELGERQDSEPVQLKYIAKKQELPIKYLEAIFNTLKKNGIVKSVRGANGGYLINKDTEKIKILDIVEIFEGKLKIVHCKDDNCSKMASCPTYNIYNEISNQFRYVLNSYSLKNIIDQNSKNNKNLNYSI